MKHMRTNLYRTWLATLAVAIAVTPSPVLAATDYSSQVDAMSNEVTTYKAEQTRLGAYAASLETAVGELNRQLSDVQLQISYNQTRYDQLSDQVKQYEKDVTAKASDVGSVLRSSYADNDISLFEMAASSRSLSDYVDRFIYRDRLRDSMKRELNELQASKARVAQQREEVDQILRDGKTMRDTLAKKQSDQQELLEKTRGEQVLYDQLVGERNTAIADLKQKQIEANTTRFTPSNSQILAGDPNRGGYPDKWANAAQDSLVDDWGMYNRECVSYAAWKVHQTTGKMPYWGGRGNANEWPTSAQSDGIPTGNTPKKGAVAIAFIGPYGHAMFVEDVLDGGKIRVSEFNFRVDGTYTERITNSAGMRFIYFN